MNRLRFMSILVAMATLLLATPIIAAPLQQALLPYFLFKSQTSVMVSVETSNGQIVNFPVYLDYTIRNVEEGGYVSLTTSTEQQLDTIITVTHNGVISASIQALAPVTPTPIVALPPTATPTPTQQIIPTIAPAATVVPPTPTAPIVDSEQVYRIGDNVMTGDIKWRVVSMQDRGNRLTSDNQFIEDATTGGRFVQITVEIDNRGQSPASYWEPEIYDSQNRKFGVYSRQYSFIPDDQECMFLVVNPGLSKQCTHIYEVANDATGLKLKVTDFGLFFGNEAFIQLQ